MTKVLMHISEKTTTFVVAFCIRVTYVPRWAKDRHGVETVRWTVSAVIRYIHKKQKTTTFVVVFCVRVTYFPRQSPAKYRQRT